MCVHQVENVRSPLKTHSVRSNMYEYIIIRVHVVHVVGCSMLPRPPPPHPTIHFIISSVFWFIFLISSSSTTTPSSSSLPSSAYQWQRGVGGGSADGNNRQKRYNGIRSSFIGWHSIKIYCKLPSFRKCTTTNWEMEGEWALVRVRCRIWFMFVMLSKDLEILIYRLVCNKKHTHWITLSRICTFHPLS